MDASLPNEWLISRRTLARQFEQALQLDDMLPAHAGDFEGWRKVRRTSSASRRRLAPAMRGRMPAIA